MKQALAVLSGNGIPGLAKIEQSFSILNHHGSRSTGEEILQLTGQQGRLHGATLYEIGGDGVGRGEIQLSPSWRRRFITARFMRRSRLFYTGSVGAPKRSGNLSPWHAGRTGTRARRT